MKRLIALLVAVVLAMALAACGSQESHTTEPSGTTGSQEPSGTTGETSTETDPTYAPGTVGVSSSGDLPTETLASTSGDLGTEPDLPATDGDLSSDPTE